MICSSCAPWSAGPLLRRQALTVRSVLPWMCSGSLPVVLQAVVVLRRCAFQLQMVCHAPSLAGRSPGPFPGAGAVPCGPRPLRCILLDQEAVVASCRLRIIHEPCCDSYAYYSVYNVHPKPEIARYAALVRQRSTGSPLASTSTDRIDNIIGTSTHRASLRYSRGPCSVHTGQERLERF